MRMAMDPEYDRWKRKYPRFPGVAKCVDLLRSRNVHGSWVDIICQELQDHVAESVSELLTAFRAEPNGVVRLILLGIIAEARLPEALPLLTEYLHSTDVSLQRSAEFGLQNLGTSEARQVLWEAKKCNQALYE